MIGTGHRRPTSPLWVVLSALAILAAACGGGGSADTAQPGETPGTSPVRTEDAAGEDEASAPSGDAWRLVMLTNQSGPFAPSGRDALAGAQLRVDEINEEGGVLGRPIELDVQDTATDATRATRLAESLQPSNDLMGVIGPEGAATSLAAKPVLAEKGILQYANTGFWIPGQDGAPGDFDPLYFATHGPTLYGGATAPYRWMESEGYQTVGLLRSSDASGDLYSQLVQMGLEDHDVELVGEEVFDVEAVDVSAQMANLVDQNPDVIYIGTTGPGLATALQAAQDLGVQQPIWAGWGSTTKPVAELVADRLPPAGLFSYGEAVHVYDELPDDWPQKPLLEEVAPAFEEAGTEPTFDGAAAYDQVSILAMALEEVGEADHEAMAEWMETDMGEYVGIAYTYEFSEDDHRGIEGSGIIIRFGEDADFRLVTVLDE